MSEQLHVYTLKPIGINFFNKLCCDVTLYKLWLCYDVPEQWNVVVHSYKYINAPITVITHYMCTHLQLQSTLLMYVWINPALGHSDYLGHLGCILSRSSVCHPLY